jgi:membrane fusion protein (multidrug efflux system)
MSRGAKAGIWILILVIIIAMFAITALRRLEREEIQSIEDIQKAEGIPVDVVQVKVVRVEDWREFSGVAEGYEQVDLVAPFRTRVQAVYVKVGDVVPRGKVLVSLDPYDPARFAMNLRTARTQYETAKQDSLRMEALFAGGAVSQQALDHVRASTEAARAQYLTARRAVELDTPISGVVTSVTVEDGDYAVGEKTVVTVSSYERIRITLELSETDRSLVRKGQSVRLFLDERKRITRDCADGETTGMEPRADNSVLTGEVVKVALSADPATRLFSVEIVVENPDHLLQPGTLVAPEILVAATDDLPVVPPNALLKHDGKELMYIIDETGAFPVARVREVTRGVENGLLLAVKSGLSVGERVVIVGQNKLEDGVKVKIHSDKTSEYYGSGF